jgi:hypothetical protein
MAKPPTKPPGNIVNHIPASSGKYIGSPSIAVLPNGDYIASHDFFRSNKSGLNPQNELVVFGSSNRGRNWHKRAELTGFWQNLFVHDRELYLMGLTKEYGQIIIRRSTDCGFTWTEPLDESTGVLLGDREYHTAPTPMITHNNRIWRAMEVTDNCAEWATCFCAFVMSAPVNADLLKTESWTITNRIPCDLSWLNGDFGGWLEGNIVVAPNGKIVNILRVDLPHRPEKAAVITISVDGLLASFDPEKSFIDFPGGAKKFSIRFDHYSGYYWSLVNNIKPEFEEQEPALVRNTLSLSRSVDLKNWEIRSVLLEHPDVHQHGFQYVDWLFDGNDMIAVVRTAYDDSESGANSAHNANYLTFHRFENFRTL